jgi:tetratricopeptide (TPR) repeat protein
MEPRKKTLNNYINDGNRHYGKGKYDRAIQDFTLAIGLDADCYTAYNNRAQTYNMKKQYDLAIADCSKALELNPKSITAHNSLGYAYKYKEQNDIAILHYEAAMELEPNNAYPYLYRAYLYNSMRRPNLATADCNKAIALDPNMALNNKFVIKLTKQTKQTLSKLIKNLPGEKALPLTIQCLNKDMFLGKLFRLPENTQEKIFGSNILKEVRDHFSSLAKRMALWTFLYGPRLVRNKRLSADTLLRITEYFLQVSGLELSTVTKCLPKIYNTQMTMFPNRKIRPLVDLDYPEDAIDMHNVF